MPIHWVRGDDERLKNVFSSLKGGQDVREPISILNCGCGKTYMLEDGGHRITAAYKLYQKTGKDVKLRVHTFVSDVE